MATACERQIAAPRGPQQKPENDSGRARPEGMTGTRLRHSFGPRTEAP